MRTFNEFCQIECDGLYDSRFPDVKQCTGYLQLKKMVQEGITPASLEEMERWEKAPEVDEIISEPDIKYLRFLHPLLRPYIVQHWDIIKTLKMH